MHRSNDCHPPTLFQNDYSDATQLALLNEFDKANVGFVKCVCPRWSERFPEAQRA